MQAADATRPRDGGHRLLTALWYVTGLFAAAAFVVSDMPAINLAVASVAFVVAARESLRQVIAIGLGLVAIVAAQWLVPTDLELAGWLGAVTVTLAAILVVVALVRRPPTRAQRLTFFAYATICLATLGGLTAIVAVTGYGGTAIAVGALVLAAITGSAWFVLHRRAGVDETPAPVA